MSADAVIIDGYVDEPACLGVPPYISPYIRTIAGVLESYSITPRYLTIDQIRADPGILTSVSHGLAVMVAGVTVPGRYLGGTPASLTEIQQIGSRLRGMDRLVAGPIGFGYSPGGGEKATRQAISGFDHLLTGSPAEALDAYLSGGKTHGAHSYARSDPWAVAGSGIIRQHPSFPHIMCEMESARGCARSMTGGCSFCTEPFYGPPRYRSIGGIAAEVSALHGAGARHFRIGRQPDLLSYGAGHGEFPQPRPDLIGELFREVRAAAPDLRTLHIDNINPGTLARHEEAGRLALQEIVRYHTPGDVAALGMETADPVVIQRNNLKAGPGEVMRAVTIINEAGGERSDGIPGLLPGLNFITGLAGETKATFRKNEQFLARVLASGLLVRRVNIRQLMPFEGTLAYTDNALGRHAPQFRAFKENVRKNFDLPMLRQVFPVGTILRDIIIEEEGPLSFGRQMGSYPILAGIPLHLVKRTILDAVVVDHGMRSITALPVPVNVNSLPLPALKWIPGLNATTAAKIAGARPLAGPGAFRSIAGTTPIDHLLAFTSPSAQ
ncbi:MAG: radical SAM protein [Methanoregulaceae archaeon]|nr:radical SAM protein [Methanoregulaceae archaeon]